ncbi:neuraminidase-like domain-containing protein [Pseudomonas sp. T1.Ur]|uniref:Tc toxin subunit A-related protein n=1 Tax=Pseudomonas sp. T1.Ur TaxID=2928704 RepID=UPI00201D77ED|nr:neuraminidase-like domain-containing protein [Pseudomonas sp. T1.Ur]MCL6703594.1 neuraminidase-like domain-containing protein [Pseudomonas sp. T1.Ur]
MSPQLKQQLNETLRDAMLAYYLTHVVSTDKTLPDLKTADDLYQHWLIDVLVSQDVNTSEVAAAIASLQHYINRIQLGLEPGYETHRMTASEEEAWRDRLHTYALWSDHEKLRTYPEIYLSPLLRKDKSESFELLENDLSQYRIDLKSVHASLQAYLSRFEEIANIETLNGYIDGDHTALDSSTYYLVGKSSSEKTYYWRSLGLQRPSATTQQPASRFFSNWSDWKKIDIAFPDEMADQTLRPVIFNNRLYVIWAEVTPPMGPLGSHIKTAEGADGATYSEGSESYRKSHFPKVQIKYSHKKYDDSWSAPHIVIDRYYQKKSPVDDDKNSDKDRLPAPSTPAQANDNFSTFKANLQTIATYAVHLDKLFIGIDFNRIFRIAVSLNHSHTQQVLGSVSAAVPIEAVSLTDEFDYFPTEPKRALTQYLSSDKGRFQYIHNAARLLTSTVVPEESGYSVENVPHASALKAILTSPIPDPANPKKLPDHLHLTSTLNRDFLPPLEFLFSGISTGPHHPFFLDVELNNVSPKLKVEIIFTGTIPTRFIDIQQSSILLVLANPTTNKEVPISLTKETTRFSIEEERYIIEHDAPISNNSHDILTAASETYIATLTFHTTQIIQQRLFEAKIKLIRTPPITRLYRHVIMQPITPNALVPGAISNDTMVALTGSKSLEDYEHAVPLLRNRTSLSTSLSVDPSTATKDFLHGVLVYELKDKKFSLTRHYLQYVSVALKGGKPMAANAIAPRSKRMGEAEFIDFSDTGLMFSPQRTNTRFAKELVKAASLSLDHFFSLRPEQWKEPAIAEGKELESLDFHGAHGKSFWEVFLYLPWSVAYRLNQEGRYPEAETWLGYIFDPKRPPYWNLNELTREDNLPHYALQSPYDPNHLALSNPIHLRKSLYMLYLDILVNRGDAAYRQLTPDSLGQAKLWYVRASELLGPRPTVTLTEPWKSIPLTQLTDNKSEALRQLEQDVPLAVNPISVEKQDATPWLKDTDHLLQPFNPALTALWDKLESRLYNLRHNLDINGNPLRLKLFAQSAGPFAFRSPNALYGPGAARVGETSRSIAHYRFQALAAHAMSAVEHIIQFGNTLLSLIERQEQAEHLQLQQQHAWDLAKIVVDQHTQALVIDQKNLEALQASRALIEARIQYFAGLLDEGINQGETVANQHYDSAARHEAAAAVAGGLAGVAMLAPNIFGLANGGMRWEGLGFALQAAAEGEAGASRNAANMLDRSAQFTRRAEEWVYAKEQADLELAQLEAQFKAYQEQEKATHLQLKVARTSLEQTRSIHDLLSKRFSKAQLYQWLNGQLATLYHEAYGVALSLCKDAEACWQFELAQDRTFFQRDSWNNSHRGLLAGESLKLDLMKMNKAYLEDHRRDLEIVKTLSLRQKMTECSVGVLTSQSENRSSPEPWPAFIKSVTSGGTLTFDLPQSLFEADYPGQTLRRIKSISVSLPATLGPYEDIKAILTQTSHEIIGPDGKTAFTDKRSNQQIALSTGFDDSGQFTLNFGDERYLPFEFTGAISKWTLAFPNPRNQRALLESITDIIVHLRYTARPGIGGAQ